LSFNKTNKIHTFDIIQKDIDPFIKNRGNIIFYIDDILEKGEHYKDLILNSPFILLDVDPHNGKMEYAFLEYLQSINYKGFMICDDIWYFKEMRDHFWNKIDTSIKYDITEYGHWSGTGIIDFDHKIIHKLDKKEKNLNWTLVTAYFNLTKCPDASVEINKRDFNYYLESVNFTLTLPYNLVIYCDQDSYERISEIRPPDSKTKYVIKEFDKIILDSDPEKRTFETFRNKINENRVINPYYFDNRNTASYYLFCMSRYYMLKEVIKDNTFKSSHFAWINFCIERMGFSNLIHLNEALSINRDKFSTCYIDYVSKELIDNTAEYYQMGRCSMCSGFFTGNQYYMYKVCDLIEKKFLYYLEKGYGHADEQLYSPVYFENPYLFEHYYGDYHQMITNYVYIYEKPEAPIYNFISNSFKNQNYLKCYEGCQFVIKSYKLNKCELNNYYLELLMNINNECSKKIGL